MAEEHTIKQEPEDPEESLETITHEEDMRAIINVEPGILSLLEIKVESDVSNSEVQLDQSEQVEKKEKQNETENVDTGRKNVCTICNRAFPFPSTLLRHQVVHTGDRPFSCDKCQKTFAYRSDMYVHVMSHMGVKRYSCNVCHRTFSYNSELKRHMLLHTGQKPHACVICSKTFTQRSNLRRHMSVHS